MVGQTSYPTVPEQRVMAPSRRSERSGPEVATSLGVGSLKGSTAPVGLVDAYVQLLQPSPTVRTDEGTDSVRGDEPRLSGAADQPGRVLAIEQCGPTVRVLRVGRPAGFTFRPGQYVKLGVAGGKREDFSIASAPHDPYLELAIELREGGKVTPALFALQVGDAVDIGAAKGSLQLDPSASHHLMVATVTGIAPLLSMVRHALHHDTSATFTVVLGASYAVELPFHAELESLAADEPRLTYIPTVSRPDEAANHTWTGATGRADAVAQAIAGDLDLTSTHVYAVGNAGMIQSVVRDLGGAGLAISTESYGS